MSTGIMWRSQMVHLFLLSIMQLHRYLISSTFMEDQLHTLPQKHFIDLIWVWLYFMYPFSPKREVWVAFYHPRTWFTDSSTWALFCITYKMGNYSLFDFDQWSSSNNRSRSPHQIILVQYKYIAFIWCHDMTTTSLQHLASDRYKGNNSSNASCLSNCISIWKFIDYNGRFYS